MKQTSILLNRLGASCFLAIICGSFALPQSSFAKQGATDPIPGTSKGATNSGGGGGGKSSSTTTTTTTTPVTPPPVVPVQPIVTAPLTFTSTASLDGVVPQGTGSYRIDPYYPTLSLITVNVSCSSINEPDGSPCFVFVTTSGGTVYPFTTNQLSLLGQAGSVAYNLYCTPGTVVTGVTVVDMVGNVLLSGQ